MSKVSLVADGWKNKDTKVLLWAIGGEGGYSYELEEGCRTSLMNCSYEYAIEKVRRLCATTGAMCVYNTEEWDDFSDTVITSQTFK